MNWFGRKQKSESAHTEQLIKVEQLSSGDISAQRLAELSYQNAQTTLVVAFVSPHLDFDAILRKLKQAMPFAQQIVGIMTAGELSSCSTNLYLRCK